MPYFIYGLEREMMEIKYSGKAAKQLEKICRGSKKSAKMIVTCIEKYTEEISSNFDVKSLKGKHGEFKRLRIGNYRIIFAEEDNLMLIYEIKHRQEAYDD